MPDPKDPANIEDITPEEEPTSEVEEPTEETPAEEPEDDVDAEEKDEEEDDDEDLDEEAIREIKLEAARRGVAPAALQKALDAGILDVNVLGLLGADGRNPGRKEADANAGEREAAPKGGRDDGKTVKFKRMDPELEGAEPFNALVDVLEKERERNDRLEAQIQGVTKQFQERQAAEMQGQIDDLFDGQASEEYRKLVGGPDGLSQKQEKNRAFVIQLMGALHQSTGGKLPIPKLFKKAISGAFSDFRQKADGEKKADLIRARKELMMVPAGNRRSVGTPQKPLTAEQREARAVKRMEEFDRRHGIDSTAS